MLRFLGVLVIGLSLGLALVALVISIGQNHSTDAGVTAAVSVSDPSKAMNGTPAATLASAPVRVEDVKSASYAPAFYLWQDGYPADPSNGEWTQQHKASLAAYLSDWQLPPEVPDKLGRLSLAIEAHISRQHPERSARFIRTVDHACQVWIARPLAQEEVTWDGGCKDGLAEGEGVLTRSYVHRGDLYEIGYQGPMRAGKAHGFGKSVDSNSMMYEGNHVDGLYHGKGTLTNLAYDGVFNYVGEFQNGYPHGFGRKQQDNRVLDGKWDTGCYAEDGHADRVLRHAVECSEGRASGVVGSAGQ